MSTALSAKLEYSDVEEDAVRRTAMRIAIHWRSPTQAGQDLNTIDPESRPNIEAGNVLSSADI